MPATTGTGGTGSVSVMVTVALLGVPSCPTPDGLESATVKARLPKNPTRFAMATLTVLLVSPRAKSTCTFDCAVKSVPPSAVPSVVLKFTLTAAVEPVRLMVTTVFPPVSAML